MANRYSLGGFDAFFLSEKMVAMPVYSGGTNWKVG
jgi:hypothetical protein